MTESRELPSGTVTFLFTDIEGSTRLLQALGDEGYRRCLRAHDAIIRRSVAGGTVVRTVGDGFFVVFADAAAAVEGAVAAQRSLAAGPWPDGVEVRVRMGLHTGAGLLDGDDYSGIDVHRAARISDAGHGGQILLSETTAAAVDGRLGGGIAVEYLGSYRLKDLARPEPLSQVAADGLPEAFPALRTLDAVTGNLPEPLAGFVGRHDELAAVADLLSTHRIVTLTGPGGTGKTTLAIRAAARAVSRFPHGAYFVPLESVTDPGLVAPAILDALELRSSSSLDPLERLAAFLERKTLLLLVDNLEQVLGAVGPLGRLLAAAPHLTVLATSRAPLRIPGEQEFKVPPLGVPDRARSTAQAIAGASGVELFVQRARAVDRDFRLTDANAPAVAELVSRLDGLPLAIELAASRVGHLSPAAILERLGNRLLTARSSGLPARQRTMAGAIAWSYDLLGEDARTLFERLAVFVGGGRLADVEAVCDPDHASGFLPDDLADLVDHGLVVMEGEDPRYRMLVVVREFALDALDRSGAGDEVRERHARRFAALAAEAAPYLLTSDQAAWLDRLSTEHDNLRAALDWAVAADMGDLAQAVAGHLWRFWQARGHLAEASDRIDRALACSWTDPVARASALEAKGGVTYWRGDWHGALVPYEEALELLRDHDDRAALANALYNVSFPMGYGGDRDGARSRLHESLRISEEIGDRLGVGRAYWGLCDLASFDRDYPATIELAARAIAEFEALDAPFDLGWAHFMTAQAHYHLGDLDRAAEHLALGLPRFVAARDVSALVLYLYLQAAVIARQGDDVAAARMIGVVDGLKRRSGTGIADVAENRYEPVTRLSNDPRPEIVAAVEAGRAMSDGEALAFVAGESGGRAGHPR